MPHSSPQRTDSELGEFRVKGEIPVPILIVWMTAAAVPALSFFAFRAHLRSDPQTTYVLLTFAVLLSANALIHFVANSDTLLRRGFILVITALFCYLAVFAIENGAGVMWLFAYPPIIFYISDSRVGIIACGGGWLGLALLYSPIGAAIIDTPYSGSFRLSMMIVLGFEMVSCYLLDQSRRRSKLGLIQLASRFEYAAKHDALTGLANRREGHNRIDSEYQRYLRNGRGFSVMLMDIDLFKSVNDNYGHQAGDRMIKLVAESLQTECRRVDMIARWGGEEFLVLLPETDTAEAVQIANRVRQSIATQAIEFDGQAITATISVGVASIHGNETIDRVLQRADEALYQAKTQGRNQVCDSDGRHTAA
ncbi:MULTISPECIES: GGDEF domain-containing protein [Marinobacter]|uniref:diguanylate cyclase n=1 Tax=Marinobacter xestospongiae TaxID=994319 RepID=A0ABU3VUQ4_9GAMM|nr:MULTISPECIES: GGDEF domain-containing protein [Marinobacter]MCG8518988.1 GGDEF domain-containing protein [Pseudomonadales bacterium]MDV2077466.1 GGDEF domain-containing protein [Marinobacter xestospongiae]UDL04293.1 GGDEF domain-containing protein [Marinobacter sp. CA1]